MDGHSESPFHHLIYPVPDDDAQGGLGVHATLDGNGQVKFGPDVEWLDPDLVTSPNEIDFNPNMARQQEFYNSIRSYWPDLPDGSLSADYAGVRPKLWHPKKLLSQHGRGTNNNNRNNNTVPVFHDFVIAGPKQHGVRGLFHLLGIESPGLTSSLALAELVAEQVAEAEAGPRT